MNCIPTNESSSPRLYDPVLEVITPLTLATDFPLPESVITFDVCPGVFEELPTTFCESDTETVRANSEGEEFLAEFSHDMNGTRMESFSSLHSADGEEASMTYNRARCYDPTVGHWLSQEPICCTNSDAYLYRSIGYAPCVLINDVGFSSIPKKTQEQ